MMYINWYINKLSEYEFYKILEDIENIIGEIWNKR